MRPVSKAFALTALICLSAACLASDEAVDQVNIEWRKNANGIDGVRASFTLRTTRQALWAVLVDYRRFSEVFRNVREVNIIRETSDGAEVEFVVGAVVRDFRYVLERRYVERDRSIAWTKISGDLKRIEGAWTIADGPQPGLLSVTYESYVEFGWYVPAFAARAGIAREIQAMVRALRERLEGSSSQS